jgi:hypothetical protein
MRSVILALVLALALISLAGSAHADTPPGPVQCSVTMTPNSSNNSTDICAVSVGPGLYISALSLTGIDDYVGFESGSPRVSFSGTLEMSPGLTAPLSPLTLCTVNTSSTNSVPCSILPNPDNVESANQALNSFTLQLVDVSNVVTGGTVDGAQVVLTLNYFVAPVSVVPTPEPSSFALMGSGLIAVGLLACRKKKQTFETAEA